MSVFLLVYIESVLSKQFLKFYQKYRMKSEIWPHTSEWRRHFIRRRILRRHFIRRCFNRRPFNRKPISRRPFDRRPFNRKPFNRRIPFWSEVTYFDLRSHILTWSHIFWPEVKYFDLNFLLYDPIWSYLILSDPIWSSLILSDPLWSYLKLSDPIWSNSMHLL